MARELGDQIQAAHGGLPRRTVRQFLRENKEKTTNLGNILSFMVDTLTSSLFIGWFDLLSPGKEPQRKPEIELVNTLDFLLYYIR